MLSDLWKLPAVHQTPTSHKSSQKLENWLELFQCAAHFTWGIWNTLSCPGPQSFIVKRISECSACSGRLSTDYSESGSEDHNGRRTTQEILTHGWFTIIYQMNSCKSLVDTQLSVCQVEVNTIDVLDEQGVFLEQAVDPLRFPPVHTALMLACSRPSLQRESAKPHNVTDSFSSLHSKVAFRDKLSQ